MITKYECLADAENAKNEFDNKPEAEAWLTSRGGGKLTVYKWAGEWEFVGAEYINVANINVKLKK